jgi:flagellin-like protein
MKRFRRSKKALSPVIATIILIAVTVAVSIAVAAWMGALSVGFMTTEQVTITNCVYSSTTGNFTLTVVNTGTNDVTLASANVNGVACNSTSLPSPALITARNQPGTGVTMSLPTPLTMTSGSTYQIKLSSAKGNAFTYNYYAP